MIKYLWIWVLFKYWTRYWKLVMLQIRIKLEIIIIIIIRKIRKIIVIVVVVSLSQLSLVIYRGLLGIRRKWLGFEILFILLCTYHFILCILYNDHIVKLSSITSYINNYFWFVLKKSFNYSINYQIQSSKDL